MKGRTNRMSIYDVEQRKYIYSGKVLHGKGNLSTTSKPEFSNEVGSKCSSLGLFKIGKYGRMHRIDLPCFKLTGLDRTNSNALKRGILIHPSVTASLLPIEVTHMNFPLTSACEGCISISFCSFEKIKQLAKQGKTMYVYSYNTAPFIKKM